MGNGAVCGAACCTVRTGPHIPMGMDVCSGNDMAYLTLCCTYIRYRITTAQYVHIYSVHFSVSPQVWVGIGRKFSKPLDCICILCCICQTATHMHTYGGVAHLEVYLTVSVSWPRP